MCSWQKGFRSAVCLLWSARHDSCWEALPRNRHGLDHSCSVVRTFRYLGDPLCVAACLLYAINRWLILPQVENPFLRGQFNDLLLIPAALPGVLRLQRLLGLRNHDQPPRWSEIALHLVVWSILFEGIGPHVLAVTGDIWDVVAYTVGGVASGFYWNRFATRSLADP
jgi:hypothetical protein